MPLLGPSYQAAVKDVGNVLVGVAQVRVGLPSVRSGASYTATSWANKALTPVGKSTTVVDSSITVVKAITAYTANSGSGTITASGTYTGTVDGNFVLYLTGANAGKIVAPDGEEASITATVSATLQGLTFAGTITSGAAGDTWAIPCWADATSGLTNSSTSIISPYSMFIGDFGGAVYSVGGLRSASFTPSIDSSAELKAGYPEVSYDKIITGTSVKISLEALEYSNSVMKSLKDMIDLAVNQSTICSVPVEVVCRTRSGNLRTFWVPSATVESIPGISPTNDYSTFSWNLVANKATEITGASAARNAWLRQANIYVEHEFLH